MKAMLFALLALILSVSGCRRPYVVIQQQPQQQQYGWPNPPATWAQCEYAYDHHGRRIMRCSPNHQWQYCD